MAIIYVVSADTLYEGSRNIKAFRKLTKAEALRRACQEHDKTYPDDVPGMMEDTPEGDRIYKRWCRKLKSWQDKHPNGLGSTYDSYSVTPLELE